MIQAGALGVNGAVYVLDMGTPVKIVDLARDMIRLWPAPTTDDVEIEFTGLRPGEKLHEELFTEEEQLGATAFDQIMVAHHEPSADEHARACVDAPDPRRGGARLARDGPVPGQAGPGLRARTSGVKRAHEVA